MQANDKLSRKLQRKDKIISSLRAKVDGFVGESSRLAEVRGRVSELEEVMDSKEKEIAELRAENAALV